MGPRTCTEPSPACFTGSTVSRRGISPSRVEMKELLPLPTAPTTATSSLGRAVRNSWIFMAKENLARILSTSSAVLEVLVELMFVSSTLRVEVSTLV